MSGPHGARTASAARGLSDIFAKEVARKGGIHNNTLHHWMSGKAAATVLNMKAVLAALSLNSSSAPIHDLPEEQIRGSEGTDSRKGKTQARRLIAVPGNRCKGADLCGTAWVRVPSSPPLLLANYLKSITAALDQLACP